MHWEKTICRNVISVCRSDRRRFALKTKEDNKKKYTHTIKLPKTDFPHWMSVSKRIKLDEYILKECKFGELYSWQRECLNGPEFVLHDGPPYANGLPHMGHAINKILKDIINRSKILSGRKVDFRPGWDCHGLPIELKALKGKFGLDPLVIREKARKYAETALNDQKVVFQSWGLMADWKNNCYYTFQPSYIKHQIKQFYNLYKKKLVFRDMKPVYWSPSSRTALAEAELEYKSDHKSNAVTVRLRVEGGSPLSEYEPLYLLIWTTTPWSLPANEAVAYNPLLEYSVVEYNKEYYVISTKLIENFKNKLQKKVNVITTFKDERLSKCHYKHPLRDEVKPVLPADYVTEDVGTGLVHTAPSHGPDDYLLALKHQIPVVSYVDEAGNYTKEAGSRLVSLPAMDAGMAAVLRLLESDVVSREKVEHSYPYDWRTKKPVMIRASKQWFINTNELKQRTLEALKEVKITPERNAAGLHTQIESRPYWCISRQRVWGVPIPVLYDQNENTIISDKLINHYFELIDKEGTNFWWSRSASELLPTDFAEEHNADSSQINKSSDILDIWFDSGLSWSGVLDGKVADLYLEGIDQFTGWFQSSLLTSVALANRAPYRAILSHGFAVDDEGRKMSKSLGNVVNPQDIVFGSIGTKSEALGIDVLRWWVAGHSLQHTNIPVSKTTLHDSLKSIKKIRNSLKFLLGAIHDLPPATSPTLHILDQYILIKLNHLIRKVDEMYESYEFNKICMAVLNFSTNELSSLYCTLTKDRLYCDVGERRIAAQFTMDEVLHGLLTVLSPILPVMAEEVFLHHPHNTDKRPYFQGNWRKSVIPEREDFVLSVIESALTVREEMLMDKPANAELSKLTCTITAGEEQWNHLNVLQSTESSTDSELVEILQVPRVTLLKGRETTGREISWGVCRSHQCERCWKYLAQEAEPLCLRCSDALRTGHV